MQLLKSHKESGCAGLGVDLHRRMNTKAALEATEIVVDDKGVFDDERANKASLFSGSFRYFAPLVIRFLQGENVPMIKDVATIEQAKYNCRILDAIKLAANTGNPIVFACEENNYV